MSETTALDRRMHAFRPDLADAALKGRVERRTLRRGHAASDRGAVDADPPCAGLRCRARQRGAASARASGSSRRRWKAGPGSSSRRTAMSASSRPRRSVPCGSAPTHRVTALRTFIYPAADLKLPAVAALSLGAETGAWRRSRDARDALLAACRWHGAVVARHVAPIDATVRDRISSPSPSAS